MLSARKNQLRIAERVAVCAATACIIAALLCHSDDSCAKIALPVVFFAMGVMFYLALLIAGLMAELARALGKSPSPGDEGPYSSFFEICKQLQWAPKSYRVAALLAMLGIGVTAFKFGAISWSNSETFTSRHATGASLYLLCILIIELPVIASALRMPGSYKDNISMLGKDHA